MAQYVEAGVEARVENGAEAKIAEASVHMKSSFERLENFKVDAKTEMQPKLLDNSIKFQVEITTFLHHNIPFFQIFNLSFYYCSGEMTKRWVYSQTWNGVLTDR